jgi:hypothetical protein
MARNAQPDQLGLMNIAPDLLKSSAIFPDNLKKAKVIFRNILRVLSFGKRLFDEDSTTHACKLYESNDR